MARKPTSPPSLTPSQRHRLALQAVLTTLQDTEDLSGASSENSPLEPAMQISPRAAASLGEEKRKDVESAAGARGAAEEATTAAEDRGDGNAEPAPRGSDGSTATAEACESEPAVEQRDGRARER